MKTENIVIGQIVNTHGIKGALKVVPLTDDYKRYDTLEYLYIVQNNIRKKYYVERVQYQKSNVIIKLKGIENCNDAGKLKNLMIEVDRKHAVKLPEDTYFICDLIGLQVKTSDGILLGYIDDVFATGSNDVYVVKDNKGKQILIPAIKDVIQKVSIDDNYVLIKPIEGLIE